MFSNEQGGNMIDSVTGNYVEWYSKNRVRFYLEGDNALDLADRLVEVAEEIKSWAGKLDGIHEHTDLEPFFRLSVSLGQPRPEDKKTTSGGSMSAMDLDDDEDTGEDE